MDRDTTQLRFIADKATQLREGPGVERCALRPFSPDPRADMRQVFQRNRPLRAFSLRNNPFGESMVYPGRKSVLLTSQLLEPSSTAERTLFLELVPEPAVPVAHVLNRLTSMNLAITIDGD